MVLSRVFECEPMRLHLPTRPRRLNIPPRGEDTPVLRTYTILVTTDIRIHIRWIIIQIQIERTCIACITIITTVITNVPGVQIRIGERALSI